MLYGVRPTSGRTTFSPIKESAKRPIVHPIIKQITMRGPVKGCALLRCATALRVTEPRLRAVRELIGTRNDLLRLRRGIEQGIDRKKEGICQI
jgi:hypothetical protein